MYRKSASSPMMHWERPGGGTCTTHKGRMVVLARCAVSKKEVMTEREREREREECGE